MALQNLIDASSRVALAAFTHDLGKLAERARLPFDKEHINRHKHLYCPFFADRGYHTHVHAAYTAMAIDELEAFLPPIKGHDLSPFAEWNSPDVDDSLINASAMHHKPSTFLQWVIATADRVASGFERDNFEQYNQAPETNHYCSRMLTLFEQIQLERPNQQGVLSKRYPLRPLSVKSLFPVDLPQAEPTTNETAQAEYKTLWETLKKGIEAIPASHRAQLPLWFDHFDSLWQAVAHAIPSATAGGVKPEVSLYDHSKTTAALATAIWRYHHERKDSAEQARQGMASRNDWAEQKFLLIQGDFFGIQSFIFSSGQQTNKRAAKILRGRSFYVSLLCECAALKILETLGLPSTSQITNAAGKFLIVAPNTDEVRNQLEALQNEFNQWFLDHSYGQSGMGLAWEAASCDDFRSGNKGNSPFKELISRLFASLEIAKFQRFNLCNEQAPSSIFENYLHSIDNNKGVCAIDQRLPASEKLDSFWISALAKDHWNIGQWLASPQKQRLLISTEAVHSHLHIPLFGYHVNFTGSEDASGKFGALVRDKVLRRAFDISLPGEEDEVLFKGYARRFINAHVPVWNEQGLWEQAKYQLRNGETDLDEAALYSLKSFEHLACDDRTPVLGDHAQEHWQGIRALQTLKGDVDNLGAIFEAGLSSPTFAKMAALSRQMNNFFAIWLPWACRNDHRFRNVYTVFAGGDDFFLIGPWHSTVKLASHMRTAFQQYVAGNPELHFSAGLIQTKAGLPLRYLAEKSEDALEQAKQAEGKNAVTAFGFTVDWPTFSRLQALSERIGEIQQAHQLSNGLVYGLLELCDMAAREAREPQAARWQSYLAYRISRYVNDKLGKRPHESSNQYDVRKQRLIDELRSELGQAIRQYRQTFKIALYLYLYQVRD